MRTSPPALLPILRSRVQGDLLALTYLNPEAEYSLTELAATIGASVKAVHQEVDRLVESGLLHDRRKGQMRLVRAATDTVVSGPLTDLLAVTYGPRPVLTAALAPVVGVEQAFIYGSWAARYVGQPGPPPGDVDVLVIGTVDLDELDEIASGARQVLHREVSIRRLLPQTWERGSDPFVATIRSRPLVELQLRPEREAQA
jgi:DNA-binding transcriptional ArsR family regulator